MAKRTWLIALALAALALAPLALGGCATEADRPTRPAVEIEQAALVYASSFYGELEARSSIAIHTPEVSGVDFFNVETVLDDGTEVDKGDVVLTFDKGPVEDDLVEESAKLAVARAELRRVEQQMATERIDLELQVKRREMAVERAKLNLVAGVNLISKLEVEKAKVDLRKAELDLALAKRALSSFAAKRKAALDVERLKAEAIEEKVHEHQKALKSMALTAPADGVIFGPYTRLNWVRGKVAPGSVTRPGDKLLEIPDLQSFNAVLYVRQRDATLLQVGDEAVVRATVRPDRPIKGRVVEKESFATTRNQRLGTEEPAGNLKELKVVLELSGALPELRPGGTVRADVTARLVDRAVLVPLAALQKSGDGYVVALADGKERRVKIGKTSTTHAQVLEGLRSGDRVLLGAAEPKTEPGEG